MSFSRTKERFENYVCAFFLLFCSVCFVFRLLFSFLLQNGRVPMGKSLLFARFTTQCKCNYAVNGVEIVRHCQIQFIFHLVGLKFSPFESLYRAIMSIFSCRFVPSFRVYVWSTGCFLTLFLSLPLTHFDSTEWILFTVWFCWNVDR